MGLLTSKKFQAAVIGVVVMVLGEVGLQLDPDTLLLVVSPIIAYIVGQGVADIGKGKAEVEAANGIK